MKLNGNYSVYDLIAKWFPISVTGGNLTLVQICGL